MRQIPKKVRQALEETGKPWVIENGSSHRKIKVEGRLVGILPKGKGRDTDRSEKNIIAQIRRA